MPRMWSRQPGSNHGPLGCGGGPSSFPGEAHPPGPDRPPRCHDRLTRADLAHLPLISLEAIDGNLRGRFGLGLAEGGLYAVPPPDTRLPRADLGRDPIPRFAEAADLHFALLW